MKKKRAFYEITDLKLEAQKLLLNETLFHNANGYIGIRSVFEEGYPLGYPSVRGQYINGFYDFSKMKQAEPLHGLVEEKQTMLNIADTQTIRVYIEDEAFNMFEGTVLTSRRWLDMDKGITGRQILWRSPNGKEVEISIKRMTSFYQLPLFTIEYEILPINFSGEVIIESEHNGNVLNYVDPKDPRTADEGFQYLTPVSCEIKKGASYITSSTSKSNLDVCSCVKNVLFQEHDRQFIINDNNAICQLTTEAEEGKKIRLIKYAVFCDGIRYEDCREQASIELEAALSVTLDFLYREQASYLAEYWENCYIEIEGDDELNTAMQYNLFQLIQAVGKDRYSNIAPKGLSGEGYEGHFFWDTEMYILPFFTITNPEISKRLIEYRYAILDMAKENARLIGHRKGALYPWRTIMGRECSGYFPAGTAQYHINGDIAYSIIAYYLATKDSAFIEAKGAEIIFETARLWLDVGNFYEDKFHINDVTGPDEYTCIVNNNYYTNLLAKYHLEWAVKFYELLKDQKRFKELVQRIDLSIEEIQVFKQAAECMYLPYDEELKINPQDDSFLQKEKWDINNIPREKFPLLLHYHPLHLYRHQICKQPDTVMAHFILEDAETEETILNSYNYYERITTHDSSLSKCIFSIMAAKLCMEEKAIDYFGNSANLDLLNLHHNTKDGLHISNMGGNYMAIVYGFGGFRLKECGICFSPMLPKKWTSYRFELCYEESRIEVIVKEDSCHFMLESGPAIDLYVYGDYYHLEDELVIKRSSKCP